jgi:SAM-dependent methyltransferase
MKMRFTSEYWDQRVHHALKILDPAFFRKPVTKYLTEVYRLMATKGCSLGGARVIKLDLWNEGIEVERTILPYLVKTFPQKEFFAFDISESVVRMAKNKITKEVNLLQADLLHMPFRDSSFDILLDLSTLDHVPDVSSALKEYERVLKDKGILLLIFLTDHVANKEECAKIDNQFYLNVKSMKSMISKRFTILEEYAFWNFLISFEGFRYSNYLRWFMNKINRYTPQLYATIFKILLIIVKKIELSKFSKNFYLFFRLYCIIAKKNGFSSKDG